LVDKTLRSNPEALGTIAQYPVSSCTAVNCGMTKK
jgi:hypothetical protein